MGALQVRYMPLALSLNSDCLVTALCITKSTRDRDHSFQTRASQFLYSCPQPLGHVQCMTAGTFALVTQGMGRQTKKKKKKQREIPSWQAVHLCGVGTNPSEVVLVLSNAGAQGGSQKDLATHRTRTKRGREAHTWTAAWLDIPLQTLSLPSTHRTGGLNRTWKYSQSSSSWVCLLL